MDVGSWPSLLFDDECGGCAGHLQSWWVDQGGLLMLMLILVLVRQPKMVGRLPAAGEGCKVARAEMSLCNLGLHAEWSTWACTPLHSRAAAAVTYAACQHAHRTPSKMCQKHVRPSHSLYAMLRGGPSGLGGQAQLTTAQLSWPVFMLA